jgi:hypothetical protein
MHARTRPSLCEQLEALPEGLTGEIIDELELRFVRDTQVCVAGRCRLAPGADASDSRGPALYGGPRLGMRDPVEVHRLEAYAGEGRSWRRIGRFAFDDPVAVAPFDAVSIPLAALGAPSD